MKPFLDSRGLSRLLLHILTFRAIHAQRWWSVPWSDRSYGPDGPWQAIMVQVGGNDTQIFVNKQYTAGVELYPGGQLASMILSDHACKPWAEYCSRGGTWNPQPAFTNNYVVFDPVWRDDAQGLISEEDEGWLQAVTMNGRSIWNITLASIQNVTVTGTTGQRRGPSLGTFSLGYEKQTQTWDVGEGPGEGIIEGWLYNGYLYNQSITPSYSYALQIGSASFRYPGSLTFGGYDRGRLIAPYTTIDTKTIKLLDISIGVETGGSPFDFDRMDGLLRDSSDAQQSIDVFPDPLTPYLSLPGPTCKAIVEHLPVTPDLTTGYYLWDTKDPLYTQIVTSPSYLSFTFAPAAGKSLNVEIKVPFALLNLTLDDPITSKPTPYFPCSAFDPQLDSDDYRLGRAFLQAAFLGRNWNQRVSWLAQAPGPGAAKEGLGVKMANIEDSDTELEGLFDDAQLFAESWKPYWTPLPGKEVQSAGRPSNDSSAPSETTRSAGSAQAAQQNSSRLSVGIKAGIGIGAASLLAVVIGFTLILRRFKHNKTAALGENNKMYAKHVPPYPDDGQQPYYQPYQAELATSTTELGAGKVMRSYELPTQRHSAQPLTYQRSGEYTQ